MLIPQKISIEMQEFIKQVNSNPIEDQDAAIKAYCDKLEQVIYDAIRSITITLPPGQVIIATPTGAGANPNPIVIYNQVK